MAGRRRIRRIGVTQPGGELDARERLSEDQLSNRAPNANAPSGDQCRAHEELLPAKNALSIGHLAPERPTLNPPPSTLAFQRGDMGRFWASLSI